MKTFLSIIRNIPEPLKKFLKEKGAYRQYVKNCLNDDDLLNDPTEAGFLGRAFVWYKTKEGPAFWNSIFTQYLDRCRNL